jgi:hypothetical protein
MSFPSEASRLPTLEALERELVARADERIPPRYPRATLVAAVVAVVVALTALTPFGRAVAEQIADWIGIGDPPTREQQNPVGEPAVVIGYGTVEGARYEIVASTYPPQAITGPVPGCVSIDFPDNQGLAMASCVTPGTPAYLEQNGIRAHGGFHSRAPAASPFVVSGLARPEVSRIVISTESSATEATVAHVTPELGERIGFQGEVAYFVAFLPREDAGGPLHASGYTDSGALVAAVPVRR